jgi:hypothetical protein
MRVCKCILPYLERSTQKNLAISLKVMELMSVVQLYQKEPTLDPISLTREGSWEKELLRNVRSSLSPDKAFIIDAVLKISEAKSILNQHTTSGSNQPTSASQTFSQTNDSSTGKDPLTIYKPSEFSPIEDFEKEPIDTSSKAPSSQGFNPMDMIEKLSPLLDDNQRQMINLFTAFMK